MVKPYLLQTLKELALLGAIRNKVEISSFELAQRLETSQQTASRYLLELDKYKFITREFGVKKQLIQLTESAAEHLEHEFSQYKQIFELSDRVISEGKIVSGMGEGKYYTEQRGYLEQFQTKLHFTPFPGTLNVEINPVERNKLRLLKNYGGILINEFQTKNRTFGSVLCFHAMIQGVEGAIVLPMRSHYSTVLEAISPAQLRKKLRLNDGDEVDVVVLLKQ